LAACPTPKDGFLLSLASGTRLALCAGDEAAARVLGFLGRAAQLMPAPASLPPGTRHLLVVTDPGRAARGNLPYTTGADAVCVLASPDAPRHRRAIDLVRAREGKLAQPCIAEPLPEEQWFWQQLTRLSAAIARETQPYGGVLLHSGLAAYPDLSGFGNLTGLGGVLLAGRSGVGKSTASRRLPHTWRALADDVTLVVCNGRGAYYVHPWPTWSRFFGDEAGDGSDTWNVQQAVLLHAIVILEQGPVDRIEPLGPGHAVALLSELAQQASRYLVEGMSRDELAAFHCQRFDNLCALVRAVPAYLLHVSRDGAFWTEIERVIKTSGVLKTSEV
jgi:SynChlorMet cassette protein ScmC